MSKETFKVFARNHPELATQVINNTTSWQKLYELYEIYGEDNKVWSDYFSNTLSQVSKTATTTTTSTATIKDLMNMVRNIDLDSVQKGVNNLQKTIGLLQDIGIGQSSTRQQESYEPRPLYKYFED